MKLIELCKEDMMNLEFPGQCQNKCSACATLDGSLVFGHGLWDDDENQWENDCIKCSAAWRRFASYTFDLVLFAQQQMIHGGRNYTGEPMHLDQEDLTSLKKASRALVFLYPFEGMIKTAISSVIGIIGLAMRVEGIANDYSKKQLARKTTALTE